MGMLGLKGILHKKRNTPKLSNKCTEFWKRKHP